MPKKHPPLTLGEVAAILVANGFQVKRTRGSHSHYTGVVNNKPQVVTVDTAEKEFDFYLLKSMIQQSGLSREEFYGSTKSTAKKIY